uniref:Uncharacterized protein n=1 Tax=Daphnia magna TaxID=35525 RepID=A0A0P6GTE2_9CRUS
MPFFFFNIKTSEKESLFANHFVAVPLENMGQKNLNAKFSLKNCSQSKIRFFLFQI